MRAGREADVGDPGAAPVGAGDPGAVLGAAMAVMGEVAGDVELPEAPHEAVTVTPQTAAIAAQAARLPMVTSYAPQTMSGAACLSRQLGSTQTVVLGRVKLSFSGQIELTEDTRATSSYNDKSDHGRHANELRRGPNLSPTAHVE